MRLKDALKAGEAAGSNDDAGTEAYLVKRIRDSVFWKIIYFLVFFYKKVAEFDLRAIIFCILYRTGFDRNEL